MLNKDNLNEIVESKEYYLKTVKEFNTILRFRWAYNPIEFMDKMHKIYKAFKVVLPMTDRLNLKKIE